MHRSDRRDIDLSVVAPARNEEDNVAPLVAEVDRALASGNATYEIIVVDDGSTDRTLARLRDLLARNERLRVIRMRDTPAGRGAGQSAAFHAGFRAARGSIIASLDADLQNDPADIPRMLDRMHLTGADVVQGDRSQTRQDTFARRAASVVGRLFRRWLLRDTVRDTGCSLRVMRREVALRLPLQFRGMHRFVPLAARDLGFNVVEMPVRHRARRGGRAKYGVWNRALPGLIDCLAVRWMRSRRRSVAYEESARPRPDDAADSEIIVERAIPTEGHAVR